MKLRVYLWCQILCFLLRSTYCQNETSPKGAVGKLIRHLLDGYEPMAVPKWNHTEVMNVSMSFTMIKLVDLADREQTMNVIGYLTTLWKDDFLVWDPADWNGVEKVMLSRITIWTPDVVVLDTMMEPYSITKPEFDYVEVHHDGSVHYSPVGQLVVLCPLNVEYFPFDEHICAISFGNWVLTSDVQQLWISGKGIRMQAIAAHIQWRISETSAVRYCFTVEGERYDMIRIYFKLERKSYYYVVNFLIPLIVLAVLSCANFIVPLDHCQRLNVSMVVLLSFVVFQLTLCEIMPRTSDHFPYISSLIFVEMGLLCISIIVDATLQWLAALDPIDGLPNPLPGGKYKTTTCKSFLCFCMLKNYKDTELEDNWWCCKKQKDPSVKIQLNGKGENGQFIAPGIADLVIQRRRLVTAIAARRNGTAQTGEHTDAESADKSDEEEPKTWRDLALKVDKYFFRVFVLSFILINVLFFCLALSIPHITVPTEGRCPGFEWKHVDVLDQSEVLPFDEFESLDHPSTDTKRAETDHKVF